MPRKNEAGAVAGIPAATHIIYSLCSLIVKKYPSELPAKREIE
jgi:hypothetical protein